MHERRKEEKFTTSGVYKSGEKNQLLCQKRRHYTYSKGIEEMAVGSQEWAGVGETQHPNGRRLVFKLPTLRKSNFVCNLRWVKPVRIMAQVLIHNSMALSRIVGGRL